MDGERPDSDERSFPSARAIDRRLRDAYRSEPDAYRPDGDPAVDWAEPDEDVVAVSRDNTPWDLVAPDDGPDQGWQPEGDEMTAVRSSPITPARVFLVIGLLGAAGFAAYSLTIRDQSQVPMLATAAGVMGIVLGAWAIAFAVGIRRSSITGHDGRALLFALIGGVFGMAALGAFAATVILALLWRPTP